MPAFLKRLRLRRRSRAPSERFRRGATASPERGGDPAPAGVKVGLVMEDGTTVSPPSDRNLRDRLDYLIGNLLPGVAKNPHPSDDDG